MQKNSQAPKAVKPSPRVRAEFREVARDIIAKDRRARKNGLSQNTIGEIERAMIKAFVIGQETLISGQVGQRMPEALEWLGRVDKRDSQILLLLIQDCFLRISHGSRGFVGCGVGPDWAAAAA